MAAAAWRWRGGSLAVARRRRQLGGGSLAAAAWRRQLGGDSLAAAAWWWQLGGGNLAAAAWRWRGGSLAVARRRRQLCGGSLVAAAWLLQLGGGATALAARYANYIRFDWVEFMSTEYFRVIDTISDCYKKMLEIGKCAEVFQPVGGRWPDILTAKSKVEFQKTKKNIILRYN